MLSRFIGQHQSGARLVLLAGAAGGLAEIIWVSLYAAATPLVGLDVAREVTASVFGPGAVGSFSSAIGILIHFLLSFAIAAAFSLTLWQPVRHRFGRNGVVACALAVLAGIWSMNFFVVLPVVNPNFIELMPLTVTLTSKLLFGLAMGGILADARASREVTARSGYVYAQAHL